MALMIGTRASSPRDKSLKPRSYTRNSKPETLNPTPCDMLFMCLYVVDLKNAETISLPLHTHTHSLSLLHI